MMTERRVPFVLFGVGGVGSELLKVILASRRLHSSLYGLRFTAVGVADSSGALMSKPSDAGELSDATLEAVIQHKAAGKKLSQFEVASAIEAKTPEGGTPSDFIMSIARECGRHSSCMLIDCSATEATIPALVLADELPSLKVVSANKKPFAADLATFKTLTSVSMRHRVRHESTVVAGVPVIAALSRVVASADPVSSISGSFSGTLGYVMSGLQEGGAFSEVVSKAKELGYTEPDPRDDLGGVDVARKALILARMLGMQLEMSDVQVEPLYPPVFASLSVPEFMERLPELDDDFRQRVSAASAEGKALRYAAKVTVLPDGGGSLVVGLQAVGADTPLGTLKGSDNLVEISTAVYSATPLVLRGAGAGAGGTAAGVLADMVELAFTHDQ